MADVSMKRATDKPRPDEDMVNLDMMAEIIGVSRDKAEELWNKAKKIEALDHLTPKALAEKLRDDLELRKRLERMPT